MRKTITLTIAALGTAGAFISSPLIAQQVTADTPVTATATAEKARTESPIRAEWMNIKQAYEALEKAGYNDIRSISTSRHGYKARAVTSDNERVRLLVHPTDGTVTVQQRRNKDDDCNKSDRSHHKGKHD